jgi:copper chaperone CopZ
MSGSKPFVAAAVGIVLLAGCSESAPVDDAALSNSEAAAMVAEETAHATPAAFNAEGAPTVAFSVPDMMCEVSCVPAVRAVLAKQPGVKDVKVELETKTATVAVDEATFDAEAAVAALVDKQFKEAKLLTAQAGEGTTAAPSEAPAVETPENTPAPESPKS